MRDGTPLDRARLAHLELGKSTIDDVLFVAGAPDGVTWVDSEDVLIYSSARARATHWTADNPATFTNRLTPQGFAGEMVAVAMFTVGGTGRFLPQRPPPNRPMPEATPEIMGAWGKPVKLNNDNRGDDQFRFHFEPERHTLCAIEEIHALPDGGTRALANNTFLH